MQLGSLFAGTLLQYLSLPKLSEIPKNTDKTEITKYK